VATLLAPMGLRLSPEKTRVVHIDDGFDFLGFHIRRMRRRGSTKWFVYTRPSKKAIASIKGRVKTMTYRATLHHDPGYLMDYLGRVLRGWANYFRHGVSKATFSAIDSYAWERITSWLRDKHKIGWPELRRRFCLPGTWRLAVDGIRFKGFQMGGVRTSIIGRPRRLPRDRRAALRSTVDCEEPHNGHAGEASLHDSRRGLCGLLFGEAAALRRRDVDLSGGVIHVRQGAVRVPGKKLVGPPKTVAVVRDVAMPGVVVDALRKHLGQGTAGERSELVFAGSDGSCSRRRPDTSGPFSRSVASARRTPRMRTGSSLPSRRLDGPISIGMPFVGGGLSGHAVCHDGSRDAESAGTRRRRWLSGTRPRPRSVTVPSRVTLPWVRSMRT